MPDSARRRQNGARSTWPGDRSPAGMMRHPDRLEPGIERELQLDQRVVGVLERHDADTHQAVVVGAEFAHRPIVCACGAVAELVRQLAARRERGGHTVGGEDELLAKAQHVEGHGAIVTVERSERLDLLRCGDELVAEGDLRFHVFGRMPFAVRDDDLDLLVGDE